MPTAKNTKKIIFMGTPGFAVPALERLVAAGHEVVAIYTAPPKPAGRGKELRRSQVHEAAAALGLEDKVVTPASLKAETLPECDIAVVAAYGALLPKHILDAPKFGCINIHPSLLPRWRGAAPLQRIVMAGDKETAVCIMQMDVGLDTGDVLAIERFTMPAKITAGELHDKCAAIGAKMTAEVVANIESLTPIPQSADGVEYAKKITREDERINWAESAAAIECKIRGLNPFPGAYFEFKGEKFKVFGAEVIPGSNLTSPATFIDDLLTISCGSGALRLTHIQRPGKRVMVATDFLNGYKIPKGTCLVSN